MITCPRTLEIFDLVADGESPSAWLAKTQASDIQPPPVAWWEDWDASQKWGSNALSYALSQWWRAERDTNVHGQQDEWRAVCDRLVVAGYRAWSQDPEYPEVLSNFADLWPLSDAMRDWLWRQPGAPTYAHMAPAEAADWWAVNRRHNRSRTGIDAFHERDVAWLNTMGGWSRRWSHGETTWGWAVGCIALGTRDLRPAAQILGEARSWRRIGDALLSPDALSSSASADPLPVWGAFARLAWTLFPSFLRNTASLENLWAPWTGLEHTCRPLHKASGSALALEDWCLEQALAWVAARPPGKGWALLAMSVGAMAVRRALDPPPRRGEKVSLSMPSQVDEKAVAKAWTFLGQAMAVAEPQWENATRLEKQTAQKLLLAMMEVLAVRPAAASVSKSMPELWTVAAYALSWTVAPRAFSHNVRTKLLEPALLDGNGWPKGFAFADAAEAMDWSDIARTTIRARQLDAHLEAVAPLETPAPPRLRL